MISIRSHRPTHGGRFANVWKPCFSILALVLFGFVEYAVSQENLPGVKKLGFEYKLEKEEVLNPTLKLAQLFVYLEEKNFNAANLTKLFRHLAQGKPGFDLSIRVVTDEAILFRLIQFYDMGVPDFENTPSGMEAARAYYDRYYPPETGYYRAVYNVSEKIEYFDYSTDKNTARMVRVDLRVDRSPEITPKQPGTR